MKRENTMLKESILRFRKEFENQLANPKVSQLSKVRLTLAHYGA